MPDPSVTSQARAKLILASGSVTRLRLLREAGVAVRASPVDLDEESIRAGCLAEGFTAQETAVLLAKHKALSGSSLYPDRLVLGADQMLSCQGRWLDKPTSEAHLREQLLFLRGKEHSLITAATVVRGGEVIWQHSQTAHLLMRDFTDEFLEEYILRVGVLGSVGGYQIEGQGIQLFDRVRGDYFGILGLPLLEVLGFLREHGLVGR